MTETTKLIFTPFRWGTIARGAASSIAIRIIALGLGFAQAILTARLLGPEGYGIIAVALSIQTITAGLATLGMGQLSVREIALLTERSDWRRLRGFLHFSTINVFLMASIAAVTIGLLALTTPLFSLTFRPAIALATLAIPLSALMTLFCFHNQGFGWVFGAQAPAQILRPLIIVTMLGLLLGLGIETTPLGYLLVTIAAALSGTILAAVMVHRIVASRVPACEAAASRSEWSRAAVPFLGITLLTVVGTEATTLMLGAFAGAEEAGLFQPILRLTPILLIVTEAIAVPFAPRLAQLWQQGDIDGIRQLFKQATVAGTLGTIIIAVAVSIFAPDILGVFGGAFIANERLLIGIAAAQILTAGFGAAGLLLAMVNRMGLRLIAQTAALAVQIGGGLLLIGPFGAHGAAAALIASLLTWSIVHWYLARNALGIDTSLFGAMAGRLSRRTELENFSGPRP